MSVTKWHGFYDLVILPSEAVKREAIKLSAELFARGSRWQLGETERIPHLSLLHIPVHDCRLAEFIMHAGRVIRKMGVEAPQTLQVAGIHVREIHGAVFLMTERPAWLSELALGLAQEFAKFREASYDLKSRWGMMTPSMAENLELYGTPMLREDFEPHFTLGTFRDKNRAKKAAETITTAPAEFRVESIHLCPLYDGFTCGTPIGSFSLK
jgi:hypothetical protein